MPAYKTKQREILLDVLLRHKDEEVTARQLAAELAPEKISLSAVYRNLAALEADGKILRATQNGSREAYFRYLDAGDCRAHLHLSCSSCGKTFHMSAARTDSLIDSVEGNENFLIDRSNTVLYGLCDKCQTKK